MNYDSSQHLHIVALLCVWSFDWIVRGLIWDGSNDTTHKKQKLGFHRSRRAWLKHTVRMNKVSGEESHVFLQEFVRKRMSFLEGSALSNRKACVVSLWSNLKVKKCSNRAEPQWFSSDTGRVSAVKQMCSALTFPCWGLSSGSEINSTKEINALRLFVISDCVSLSIVCGAGFTIKNERWRSIR